MPWTEAEKLVFLRMQFDAQDSYYRQSYPDARFDVIEQAGTPVGRLYVARLEDELRVIDIALLPEHRGRGIGSQLMSDVLAEADARHLRVTLHVEPWNRARELYIRLGFRVVRRGDVYDLMERPAGQLNAAS